MKSWMILLVLAGCATTDPVLDMGSGKHSVTASGMSMAHARESATKDANVYCAQARKTASIESFDDKIFSSFWGAPTASAVFTCN